MAKHRKLLSLALALIFSLSATLVPPASARDDPGIAEPNIYVAHCAWCPDGMITSIDYKDIVGPICPVTSCSALNSPHSHQEFVKLKNYHCNTCGVHSSVVNHAVLCF